MNVILMAFTGPACIRCSCCTAVRTCNRIHYDDPHERALKRKKSLKRLIEIDPIRSLVITHTKEDGGIR